MKKQVLVVGGAGYIGSHMAMALNTAGYDVIVFDNLSTGHQEFLRFGRYVIGDLANPHDIDNVLANNTIDAVMHFAGFINVGESVGDPEKYYINNCTNTQNLLSSMCRHNVNNFIFSSTCAIYGSPQKLPLHEDHPVHPINPYGRTKLAVEWMLEDFSAAYDFKYCALRYFNAAGAAPKEEAADIGEWHEPETHLIPLVLQAAADPQKEIRIFGEDYNTPDGTCIRDYIHVCDLASAHILAMERLLAGEPSRCFNLGNGKGYSVHEVIESAKRVTKRQPRIIKDVRRPGDPDILIGDASRALVELGWKPRYDSLDAIVQTAWDWELSRQ